MAIDTNFVKLSRQLRKDRTPWEKKLWMYLKASKFYNYKFKRQVVIGFFIYDFSCFEKKLIIELDGSQHMEGEVKLIDAKKEEFAKGLGYKVFRFNNNDIQNNIEGVLETIRLALQ
ncbi:MAG: endonuclease domain-containing protein [Candidatus Doudnabacteria bacterium]|nr:endonuclease domain-containing protein [Candidatus Doudnabacteria bacterium]